MVFDIEVFDGLLGFVVDFIDLYVWFEVYILGVGWIGLDLMLGLLVGEGYILLVVMFYFVSVVFISGGIDLCDIVLEFFNIVICVYEDLCVMLFYIDEFWKIICEVG